MIYSVSSELYREAAVRLTEAAGGAGYFSGSLGFRFAEAECRLTASVILYRRTERLPEGDCEVVADLVPVWWGFRTVVDGEERLNDFSFDELRRTL